MIPWACFLVPTKSTEPPSATVLVTHWAVDSSRFTVWARSMMWMPLRAVKMYCFIFGFQRLVWCPKWTPASRSCLSVTAGISGVYLLVVCRRPNHPTSSAGHQQVHVGRVNLPGVSPKPIEYTGLFESGDRHLVGRQRAHADRSQGEEGRVVSGHPTPSPMTTNTAPKATSFRIRTRRRSSAAFLKSYSSERGKLKGGSSDSGRS